MADVEDPVPYRPTQASIASLLKPMAQKSPEPLDPTRAQAIMERLVDRASRISLIDEALRSTLKFDELYKIIVATLISRRTMGFSRAMLFAWDDRDRRFHARAAFGAKDRECHDRIQEEIGAQEQALEEGKNRKPAPCFPSRSEDAVDATRLEGRVDP